MNDFSGWDKLLDGKIAVVTVAARGIGRAAAIALAQSGAQIAGIDISGTNMLIGGWLKVIVQRPG